MYRVRMDVVEY